MPNMPLSYIPTIQNPLSGSNLGPLLQSLKGGSPATPNILGAATNAYNAAGGNDPLPTDNNSMFGGINYNNLAQGSGVSGSDMAEAAKAGVQSGLTIDPFTGTVS